MTTTMAAPANLPAILSPNRMLNINEASKACGLSPSVLRIWELRYGWPNPRRKPNGYRAYNAHLVEDLRRVAELMRAGVQIRQIIQDGLPRWPDGFGGEPPKPRTLDETKALPQPSRPSDVRFHREVLEAVETRHAGRLRQLLQRCQCEIRPEDEALTCLVPVLCGLEELRRVERPLGRDEAGLLDLVHDRAAQLLRRRPLMATPEVAVQAATGAERSLAAVAVLLLRQRGIAAVVADGQTPARLVQAGGTGTTPRIAVLAETGAVSLARLLDHLAPLPWEKAGVA